MDRGSGSHYTIPFILTVNDLLRVSPRIPLYCLMHCHTQSDYTLSGNRLWRPANMRRRSMTLVLSVMLQILTVRNCAESKTNVPVLFSESDGQTVLGVAIGARWKRRRSTYGTQLVRLLISEANEQMVRNSSSHHTLPYILTVGARWCVRGRTNFGYAGDNESLCRR